MQILRQLKAEFGFCRYLFLASGIDLRTRSTSAAGKCSYRGAFAAAKDCSQHRSNGSSSAHILACTFVRSQAAWG